MQLRDKCGAKYYSSYRCKAILKTLGQSFFLSHKKKVFAKLLAKKKQYRLVYLWHTSNMTQHNILGDQPVIYVTPGTLQQLEVSNLLHWELSKNYMHWC